MVLPLQHVAIKLQAISLVHKHCNRGLSISSMAIQNWDEEFVVSDNMKMLQNMQTGTFYTSYLTIFLLRAQAL